MKSKMVLMAITLVVFSIASVPLAYAAPPADACALVTPAQVSAALGVTVKSGEYMFPSNKTICTFDSAGAKTGVEVAIVKLSLFNNEKTPMPGVKEEQAKGIGDEAHYMTTPGFPIGLTVKKGNFAFKVRAYGFTPQQVKEKDRTLALKIIERL